MTNVLGDCIGTRIVEVISQKELRELNRLEAEANAASASPYGPSASPLGDSPSRPTSLPAPAPNQPHGSNQVQPQNVVTTQYVQIPIQAPGYLPVGNAVTPAASPMDPGMQLGPLDQACELSSVLVSPASVAPSPFVERQTNL